MSMEEIEDIFKDVVKGKGILGAASYEDVFHQLMPVQRKNLSEQGIGKSLIVFGIFHSHKALQSINVRKNGKTDYEAWNIYAREYHILNKVLNRTANIIAEYVKGVPLFATPKRRSVNIFRVEDYYALTISQRVGAELSGLGWRGKNELIITRERGCAVRFASVICPDNLPHGQKMDNYCGTCNACLKVCPFLRKKNVLKNYHEQCRRFIATLRLDSDVCGKCVKACYNHWVTA